METIAKYGRKIKRITKYKFTHQRIKIWWYVKPSRKCL